MSHCNNTLIIFLEVCPMSGETISSIILNIISSLGGGVGISLIAIHFLGRRIEERVSKKTSMEIDKKLFSFQQELENEYYGARYRFDEKNETIKSSYEIIERFFCCIKKLTPQYHESSTKLSLDEITQICEEFDAFFKKNRHQFSNNLIHELDSARLLYDRLKSSALDGLKSSPVSYDEIRAVEGRVLELLDAEQCSVEINIHTEQ